MGDNRNSPGKMERDSAVEHLRTLLANQHFSNAREDCIELSLNHPQDTEIWLLRVDMHFQLGELDAAITCCRHIVSLDDRHVRAHFGLGLALHNLKRLPEAERAYRAAFHINPRDTRIIGQLAKLLMEQNRLADIRELLDAALAHSPHDDLLYYNLGGVLVGLGEIDAALNAFENAARINPRSSHSHFQLGVLYAGQDKYDTAIASLLNATSINPDDPQLLHTLASTHVDARHVTDAIDVYKRIITANPADADAHARLGMCHLLLANFRDGWPEYEWRLRTQYMGAESTEIPQWKGEPVAGRTVLLLAEQGFGDTIQFIRYAPEIKARGAAKVILGCRPALARLLAECDGIDQVACEGDRAPPFNVEVKLLSLPGIFRTTPDTIPATVPYLRVPQGAGAQATSLIMQHADVLRVGLVWSGGVHTKNPRRNLTLAQFRNLLAIKGVRFFSLQKGEAVAQCAGASPELLIDLAPHLDDFADTAAAIASLDLVISVDTSVAHVAGALARPVWTLLPYAPDWRWMLERNDTPWYPTMRLFRQDEPGNWEPVIARVCDQLITLALNC